VQADAGIYGPLQYSQGWMWTGLALLVLVLGGYAFVFLGTGQQKVPAQAPRFTPPSDLTALKEAYLQAADPGELQRAPADGDVGGRTELYWLLAAGAFLLALRETFLELRQWRQLRPGQGVRT